MGGKIISIHVGQAGVQIGNACWELFCIEHGILPNGEKATQGDQACSFLEEGYDGVDTFFHETATGRYVPRSVFTDTDSATVDEIKNNQYRELFRSDSLLSWKEDAANSYGRGYYTVGGEIIGNVMDSVRQQLDMAESLEGFFIFHSMGGGTGSGLSTLLMEELTNSYQKINKLEFMVFPSPTLSTSTVEPYNAVLSAHGTMDLCDCGFMMDNESMYGICRNLLNLPKTMYGDINRLVAQVISSLTASARFDGSLSADMMEFQTNLVPFPRIKFPLVSYAPFQSRETSGRQDADVKQLTRMVFDSRNQMLKCETTRGKYLACCLLYRGSVAPRDVYTAIGKLKTAEQVKFVNWCPTGFKVAINYQPPISVPGSYLADTNVALCGASNTTAIAEAWTRVDYKFDLLFSKRSFIHWYTSEGMDVSEFVEARDDLASLEQDFQECVRENPE